MKLFLWQALEWLGWACCEIAFRTDCWGPFAWLYSLGCRIYGLELQLGERWGFYVKNPRFGQPGEPELLRA